MKLSDLAKRMVFTILIITLICILGSAIYYRSLEFLPYLYGAILGSVVSIFKVFLLERTVNKAVNMEQKTAGNYASLQHMIRLLLTGVALVLGAIVPQISLLGVATGVLSFQLAVYNIKFTAKSSQS